MVCPHAEGGEDPDGRRQAEKRGESRVCVTRAIFLVCIYIKNLQVMSQENVVGVSWEIAEVVIFFLWYFALVAMEMLSEGFYSAVL